MFYTKKVHLTESWKCCSIFIERKHVWTENPDSKKLLKQHSRNRAIGNKAYFKLVL